MHIINSDNSQMLGDAVQSPGNLMLRCYRGRTEVGASGAILTAGEGVGLHELVKTPANKHWKRHFAFCFQKSKNILFGFLLI